MRSFSRTFTWRRRDKLVLSGWLSIRNRTQHVLLYTHSVYIAGGFTASYLIYLSLLLRDNRYYFF